ncbi:MAG: hypothetical protein ACI4PI_01675 [Oscillospiraceae bacterium]
MRVSFTEIGETVATFESDKKLEAGTLVNVAEIGKVATAKENEKFVGIVVNATEHEASVQIKGYIKAKFEGTIEATALGCFNMCLGKEGKLKLSEKGREVLLLDINTENNEIGIFM